MLLKMAMEAIMTCNTMTRFILWPWTSVAAAWTHSIWHLDKSAAFIPVSEWDYWYIAKLPSLCMHLHIQSLNTVKECKLLYCIQYTKHQVTASVNQVQNHSPLMWGKWRPAGRTHSIAPSQCNPPVMYVTTHSCDWTVPVHSSRCFCVPFQ